MKNIMYLCLLLVVVGCGGETVESADAGLADIPLSLLVNEPEPIDEQTAPIYFSGMALIFEDGEAHPPVPCEGRKAPGPWLVGDTVCFLLPPDSAMRIGIFRLVADGMWLVNVGPI
jgi:hypothetical protein